MEIKCGDAVLKRAFQVSFRQIEITRRRIGSEGIQWIKSLYGELGFLQLVAALAKLNTRLVTLGQPPKATVNRAGIPTVIFSLIVSHSCVKLCQRMQGSMRYVFESAIIAAVCALC